MSKSFTALIILDGYANGEDNEYNAILQDGSKYITQYEKEFPNTILNASGLSVGLPEGQMGNSEVGHLNIGAGRVVYQELTRITKSIQDGDFFENEALMTAIKNCKANNSALHLMGLCSDGGVHSHNSHLYALLKMAKSNGVEKVYVHCFLDGRDVPPSSGADFIEDLQKQINDIGVGKIATVMGRYYAMDRDNRWDRVEKAYLALTQSIGEQSNDPVNAVRESYENKVYDEFVSPIVVTDNKKAVAKIEDNDSVVFFNFRPDRAREITRAFMQSDFEGFKREKKLNITYVCFTQYDATFEQYDKLYIAFKPQTLENTLGEYISKQGLKQLRIAETEKYAHVTFFFNGGVEAPNEGEDRVLIPSPKVATYDLQPEMSANEVTQEAIKLIREQKYDFMVLNFANSDMVGHTGVMEAAKKAVHTVDKCTHEIVEEIRKIGGKCLITADHGNSDKMYDPVNKVAFTAHTTNPVPLIYIDDNNKNAKLEPIGSLADIAPTLLDMMGLPVPNEMSGKSLIKK